MPSFQQQKISRHTKKEENMAHSIQQNKLTGAMPMKLQTSDLLDENFKMTA